MSPGHAALAAAVTRATQHYVAGRRARIPAFAAAQFGWAGAARLHRHALGRDLLRVPVNVLWAAPYLLTRGAAALSRRAGAQRVAERLERLPAGLRTDVERELEWRLYAEWLELPFRQGERQCERDALFEAILAEPDVAALFGAAFAGIATAAQREGFRGRLEAYLRQYTHSRTAAAELSTALINVAVGAAAFQGFTPGALAMGSAVAGSLAQQIAVAQFALGPTLGAFYYGVFPASASVGLLAATTGGLIAVLGVVAALSGVLTDPVQQALGLHERRLHKLVDALERTLDGGEAGLAIRDAYVARVFDLLDLLQTAGRLLG